MRNSQESEANIEAMGQNPEKFYRKKAWLKEKWIKEPDSTCKREIGHIAAYETSPINTSIIADNLDYFKNRYNDCYANYLERALVIACLCGSQRITEFLLGQMKSNYLSAGYEFVLSYASASMNTEWAIVIATTMAQAGKEMPQTVYSLAHNSEVMDTIIDIFNKAKSPPTNVPKYR